MASEDTYWDRRLVEARENGKEYVVYNYETFGAKFARCTRCDWTEYLVQDWWNDDFSIASLMKHSREQHREEKGGDDGLD